MGEQHVTLNIGDDGLVKSIGHDMGGSYEQTNGQGESIYEDCIMCGKQTTTLKSTHIDFRYGYEEGAGQLCRSCYLGEDRNLITIEGRTILDTPNDQELGAIVRQMYWDQIEPVDNKWICQHCGGDTSHVDNDYLSGYDHVACILGKEMKG